MADNQHIENILNNLLNDNRSIKPTEPSFFSEPRSKSSKDALEEILTQRHKQREDVLDFIMSLTRSSFLLLAGLLIVQSGGRIALDKNFSLLAGYELEVLSVSVFGQALGVIYIITKSLWDDTNYLDKIPRIGKK